MSQLSVGIVGLPNVGKSTLFNALTKQEIPAENYPFCTIDPNVGVVLVPDKRVGNLAKIENSAQTINAVVEFVDIAGLVKGASKGEGLGNQFLSHIREVDVIVQVLRFFKSEKITHVEESVDPKRDKDIVETELMLKDLDTVEKRLEKARKQARSKSDDSSEKREEKFWQEIYRRLENTELFGNWDSGSLTEEEKAWIDEVPLLSTKKVIYLINVGAADKPSEDEVTKALGIDQSKTNVVIMDVAQEVDLIMMTRDEQEEYLKELGIKDSGLSKLIKTSYKMLDLETFFTAGEQEARAWTITRGTTAPDAAAEIHTDFKAKFIALDVVEYEDFVKFNGWQGAKDAGKVRLEGRDYIVKDGDVVLVKHNA